jgi:hypothetical protein
MTTLAEKIAVMQAALEGKKIELLALNNKEAGWIVVTGDLSFNWYDYDYRVKELTKPSIDWKSVHQKFKWLARDSNGSAFLFPNKPKMCEYCWILRGDISHAAEPFASYVHGTCDWKDSLVERPSKEQITKD